jgi:hypothetical protein
MFPLNASIKISAQRHMKYKHIQKILTVGSKGVQLSVVCKMQMLFSFFYKL